MTPFCSASRGGCQVILSVVVFIESADTFIGEPVGTKRGETVGYATGTNWCNSPSCGSWNVSIAAGPELTLTAVTLQEYE